MTDATIEDKTAEVSATISCSSDDEDNDNNQNSSQKPEIVSVSIPKPVVTTTGAATIAARPPSIRLSCMAEEIPLDNKKGKWRVLPKVNVQQINLDKVRRGASLPVGGTTMSSPEAIFLAMSGGKTMDEVAAGKGNLEPARKSKGNVNFQTVQVRSYRQTLSDNPSVSYGPPIGLDWKYEQEATVPLESFEESRAGVRRPYKKLGLNYFQRKELLQTSGELTEDDIKQAQKVAASDKFKRGVTKYFLPAQILHDAAESGVRKTKRIFGGKGKNSKQPQPPQQTA